MLSNREHDCGAIVNVYNQVEILKLYAAKSYGEMNLSVTNFSHATIMVLSKKQSNKLMHDKIQDLSGHSNVSLIKAQSTSGGLPPVSFG